MNMCILGIIGRVYMSIVQTLAMGLYLAVKDIPGTCSPIKCLTKTIISKQRVVRPANRREMDVSWVFTARSVSANSAKDLKLL